MIFVGTSGWMYDWNEGGNLEWYVKYSGLNAVELNMSFYRFPFENQIKGWSKYKIVWSIKVNRYITHVKRLKDVESWEKFRKLMDKISPRFYLFQMPPTFKYNEENLRRVIEFEKIVGEKMAIEFRDTKWYENLPNLTKATIVSIDSPIGTYIVNNSGVVYLRLHGREEWYIYEYSEKELVELSNRIISLKPKEIYVFFNNDHWMLENARLMKKILEEKINSL
ncbi:DUF72 domain-containing protein [Sulfurisphaera ohwakuensis]|uniref:DUF72 domain-containing protein n=1 Tax=Sulfurisphaera ohwakuensis TaxID=69656 RepID=UPI0036F405E1